MKLLVFHLGALGDTVVAVPSLWALRDNFPGAEITLLSESSGEGAVSPKEVLENSGLVDKFLRYPAGRMGAGLLSRFEFFKAVRSGRYDMAVYLVPSVRSRYQRLRDRLCFFLMGITKIIGMNGFLESPDRSWGLPLPKSEHEADLLLARLRGSGLAVPQPGSARMDLNLGEKEAAEVRGWKASCLPDGGRRWIAIAPGSKMPAKRWGEENFRKLVSLLIDERDVWPVVFGGPEDLPGARDLVRSWGRGAIAAGQLSPRASTLAMRKAGLFVGNDTGTMHLAAAAGIPCVAIFSSRDYPGRWYPYGSGHTVLRASVACEGCRLDECHHMRGICLSMITLREVANRCRAVLDSYAH